MPINPWEIMAMEFGPMAPYFQRMGLARDQQMMGEMLGMPQLGNVRNPDVAVGLMDALLDAYGAGPAYEKLSEGTTVWSPQRGPIYTAPKTFKPEAPEKVKVSKTLPDGRVLEREESPEVADDLIKQGWQRGVVRGSRAPTGGKEADKVWMFKERGDGTYIKREVGPEEARRLVQKGWQYGQPGGTPRDTGEDKQLQRTKNRIFILEKGVENILQRYGVESGISVDPSGAVSIRTSSRDLAFTEVKRIAEGTGPRARQARRDLQDLQEKYREIERLADTVLPGGGGEPEYYYDPRDRQVKQMR